MLYRRWATTRRPSRFTAGPWRSDRAALGENHPDYAASLNNLAGLYQAMDDYAAAEPLFRQAMAIRRAALGEGHPDYAASLNNLAWLYRSMGDYAAAEPLYRQATGHPPRGAGRGPPPIRRQPEHPGGAVRSYGRLRGGRAALSARPWTSAAPRWARTTPDYASSLDILACCTSPWATTRRPSRSTARRWTIRRSGAR